MNFLGMVTTTTMLVKLKGDPKLAETLRSLLNNELEINLDILHEAIVELWPPSHSLKAGIHKFTPTKNDLVDPDPKSLFGLCMLGDYFESDESNAVLPVVCKGNAILGVLDGGACVRIVTKRCWEKMGQPQMDVADLRVKLANGGLVRALGLLRNLRVKILHSLSFVSVCFFHHGHLHPPLIFKSLHTSSLSLLSLSLSPTSFLHFSSMPLQNITNRSSKFWLHVDIEREYATLRSTLLALTMPNVLHQLRMQGNKAIDLWTDGSLYPMDPHSSAPPSFQNITSLLRFIGDGFNGLLSYCMHLHSLFLDEAQKRIQTASLFQQLNAGTQRR